MGGILAFLNALFSAIIAWQAGRQRDADRQAGRNAERVFIQAEVLKRAKESHRLNNSELDDSFLRAPETRDK
jgi:hypothetical protein